MVWVILLALYISAISAFIWFKFDDFLFFERFHKNKYHNHSHHRV